MYKMLSVHNLIIIICLLILIAVFYKLNNYTSKKTTNNEFFNIYENFESKLSKLKNNNSTKLNSSKNSSKNISKNSSKNSKKNSKKNSSNTTYTFDDVLTMSEELHPEKYTIDNIKDEVMKYANSFKKEKFKNNSKDTTESLEKFKLYKEKFFEIFD